MGGFFTLFRFWRAVRWVTARRWHEGSLRPQYGERSRATYTAVRTERGGSGDPLRRRACVGGNGYGEAAAPVRCARWFARTGGRDVRIVVLRVVGAHALAVVLVKDLGDGLVVVGVLHDRLTQRLPGAVGVCTLEPHMAACGARSVVRVVGVRARDGQRLDADVGSRFHGAHGPFSLCRSVSGLPMTGPSTIGASRWSARARPAGDLRSPAWDTRCTGPGGSTASSAPGSGAACVPRARTSSA